MVAIESTPEMVAKVYATMRRNLAVVRRRLQKPLTLADKVLLGHLDDPETQDLEPGRSYLALRPDRVVFQDVLGQTGMLQFMQTRRDARRGADHDPLRPPDPGAHRGRGGPARVARRRTARSTTSCAPPRRSTARASGGRAPGIIHQVVLENYAFPGALIIGTDSHTPNAGGLGACAVGVGGADAVEVIAGLPWEVLYPRHIAVYLTGKLSGWTAPKDVILYVAGQLTVSGGTNAIVEYIGPGARTHQRHRQGDDHQHGRRARRDDLDVPGRRADGDLPARDRPRRARAADASSIGDLLAPDAEVEADPEKYYDRVVELDLSHARAARRRPALARPRAPDLAARRRGRATPRNGFVDAISTALIGSCTNSSYEDMSRAADVAEQATAHGLKAARAAAGHARLGAGARHHRARRADAVAQGHRRDRAGERLRPVHRPVAPGRARRPAPNTIVTSYNRNFPRAQRRRSRRR